jgi:RNA polymerase sigma-70 factor (ECF subfamily)
MNANPTSVSARERRLLERAREGDEGAFREVVEPLRTELHRHCYRMLGSVHDADDALQDALVRAWRGLAKFEGRASLRAWLYRITTNACLDVISGRPKRMLPIDFGPSSDPRAEVSQAAVTRESWIEPYPDSQSGLGPVTEASPEGRYGQREAVELAFVAALQHLPPRQRAVLILRDVMGLSARESAAALATTLPSVNGALQRARRAVEDRIPEMTQQATMRGLGKEARDLVRRFLGAFDRGDIDTILAMLAEDATFEMPPYPNWCHGRAALAASWLMPAGPPPRLRHVETSANGQPAAGVYVLDPDGRVYIPVCLDVLTLRGPWIADVTAFRMPELFRRFELPAQLPAD